MDIFSEKEKQILAPYFTNLNEDVFGLVNLPEVVKGALFSRYSRSNKSLRRLLLDEFIQDKESGFKEIVSGGSKGILKQVQDNEVSEGSFIATQRAEDFYDRILVGYGDDSVAELAGVHLAVENVTQMIGAKALEQNRIGISPLEKSTRYVRYDDKVDGKYRYYRDPRLMKSKFAKLFVKTNDLLFDTYSELVEKMMVWTHKRFPKEKGVKDWVYESTIRAKACDICRQLLPLSTLTNVGLFGNGRSFEYLIIKMLASPYTEVREMAKNMKKELDKVIPSFVKRSMNERGKEWLNYIKYQKLNIKKEMEKLKTKSEKLKATTQKLKGLGVEIKADSLRGAVEQKSVEAGNYVKLVSFDRDGEEKVLAGMVFGQTDQTYEQVFQQVKWMERKDKEMLVKAYFSGRKHRHHKPGRALEMSDYVFEVMASIGCYKDLQRHRILTPMVQSYHPYFGYDVRNEIKEAGFEKQYRKAMDAVKDAFEKISGRELTPSLSLSKRGGSPSDNKRGLGGVKSFPFEVQYLVPLGYRMRWLMKMNLREVCHLTELRSQKQGHPHYRVVAQQMADEVKKVHPMMGQWATQYVDYENVELERLESEKKTEAKWERLRVKKKLDDHR